MKHRVHLSVMVSVVVIAGAHPASANPGLLHKHGHRAIGLPAMLPGQTLPGGPAATTLAPAGGAAGGAATSSIAVAAIAPVGDGAGVAGVVLVGGADGTPIDPGLLPACNLPVPVGTAHGGDGGPNVFHKLNPGVIDSGIAGPCPVGPCPVGPGAVLVDGVSPGFDPGSVGGIVDVGAIDGGDAGPVMIYAMAPGGPGAEGRHGGFAHRPLPAALASAASSNARGLGASAAATSATDGAGSAGRALAGGLPNRAAGVRTEAVATIHRKSQGPAGPAAVVAVSGDGSSDGVVQAGGVADDGAARASHTGRSRLAGGRAAVPPTATSAPKWRDRLRFAWPTPK